MSTHAKTNPNKFYIGIDANVKPLEKPSMKATRKPAKGGLPNALFVQAAAEALPDELNGVANKIHINFPWGSLLRAIATGDVNVLDALRRVAAEECLLHIVIGIDPVRDKAEIERLGIAELTSTFLNSYLIPRYAVAGFELVEYGNLAPAEWGKLDTSWSRRLQGNQDRMVLHLIFRRSNGLQIEET